MNATLERYSLGWFDLLRHLLMSLSLQGRSPEVSTLIKTLDLEQCEVDRMVTEARILASVKLSDGSGAVHTFESVPGSAGTESRLNFESLCPYFPRTKIDQKHANEVLTKLAHLLHHDPKRLERFARLYVQYSNGKSGGLLFKKVEKDALNARQSIQLFQSLGIPLRQLHFISFDVTKTRGGFASTWRKALDLHGNIQIHRRVPPNGNRDWASPWLLIQPRFQMNNKDDTQPSQGFSYAMLMAIIARAAFAEGAETKSEPTSAVRYVKRTPTGHSPPSKEHFSVLQIQRSDGQLD